MTFGGGANALVTELLGDAATISSDFGGNPPYAKMHDISRIVYKYWLEQSNVLFIIGGKANNTDIYETFRAMLTPCVIISIPTGLNRCMWWLAAVAPT